MANTSCATYLCSKYYSENAHFVQLVKQYSSTVTQSTITVGVKYVVMKYSSLLQNSDSRDKSSRMPQSVFLNTCQIISTQKVSLY